MGKLESNKLQKRTSLLNTAFNLFTTKGVSKTSIAEISKNAGIAKGTFYLYFKDKYDIRNKLVSHESSKLFKHAAANLTQYCLKNNLTLGFEDKIIFIADHIISKNLSWGIFREALTSNIAEDDVNFKDVFYSMIDCAEYEIEEPEIMLFLITELVSSTCYSAILYEEPANIETIKPYLFTTIRGIIRQHETAPKAQAEMQ